MEEEVRECKQLASAFKANPANILYEEPFIPEKSAKPMTGIVLCNFSHLHVFFHCYYYHFDIT